MNSNLLVELPRKIVYGGGAVNRLQPIVQELKLKKAVVLSGGTKTKKITERRILPLLEKIEVTHLTAETSDIETARTIAREITRQSDKRAMLIGVGGGKVLDLAKVSASWSRVDYISIPTNASHDGFSSPYLSFLLKEQLRNATETGQAPYYTPISPIVIIGDTDLVQEAPFGSIRAGVGDLVSKFSANLDWKLAHRLRGEPYDIYSATFGLMSAQMLEKDIHAVARRSEDGIRTVVKALGGSGVAVNVAGSSRPASGSEHLISHYIEQLGSRTQDKRLLNIAHGEKCGLATIMMMFLHGGDWKKIKGLLDLVGAPTDARGLGLDRDILLDALLNAHKIRPERYTILGDGLNRAAAENVLNQTGVA